MPSLWFKHEDPEILPYEVPYTDGQDTEPLIAANSGNGWSLVTSDDEPAATVDPPAESPRPAKPDHHDEEQ